MQKIPVLLDSRPDRGFTLIEVVAVLILLGILSAVAISRFSDSGAKERGAADKLKTHLRYAQGLAMNSDSSWGIRGAGGFYFLFKDGDLSQKFNFSVEDEKDVPLPSGISPSFTISFDGWGQPYDTANPEGNSPIAIDKDINIGSSTITITAETGFIQ